MTTLDLNVRYRKETNMLCVDLQTNPTGEYVKWLEQIIIASNEIQLKTEKGEYAKGYREGAIFGYKEGFKSAVSALESCLPNLEKRMPSVDPPIESLP